MFRYRRLQGHYVHVAGRTTCACCGRERDGCGWNWEDDTTEHEAWRDVIITMLRDDKLNPTDLVFSGGIWRTFAEAPEFYEVCERLGERRGSDAQVMWAALVAAMVLALMLSVYF